MQTNDADVVEVNTANGPDGQPLVVLSIFGQVGPLTLKDATDIGQALIQAVAASQALEPETPATETEH